MKAIIFSCFPEHNKRFVLQDLNNKVCTRTQVKMYNEIIIAVPGAVGK